MYYNRVQCFDSIRITDVVIEKRRIRGKIEISFEGLKDSFDIIFSYDQDISPTESEAGMVLTMPAINFTYFTPKLELDFPVSPVDLKLLNSFVRTNNREVFINKICRRRYEFFREEYLPDESEIDEKNADGATEIVAREQIDHVKLQIPDSRKAAVLSSGGKESLLTYGILNDLGMEVYPFFFNESGMHWLAAKTAYKEMKSSTDRTMKVWSNVDRFYRFMLARMKVLDPSFSRKKTDTYPIQLFIFPVYVFSLLPLALKKNIGHILIGDEFDDPREMPLYHGMRHYFGVYDQSSSFNDLMTEYFKTRGFRIELWSAVYTISGSVVERMLIERYPDLFRLQRSCHSCKSLNGQVIPCGVCTKCLGIILFVLAARGDPTKIGYSPADVENVLQSADFKRIRLDHDELVTAIARSRLGIGEVVDHVDGIHILPWEDRALSRIPQELRDKLTKLLEKYTIGYFKIDRESWIHI